MTRPSLRLFRSHPVLGRIAWCPSCGEWWPYRGPFWRIVRYSAGDVMRLTSRNPYTRRTSGESATCLVHLPREVGERAKERARAVLFGAGGRCLTPHCMVTVPWGRGWCYGCLGRTVGPMTAERLQALSHPIRREAA